GCAGRGPVGHDERRARAAGRRQRAVRLRRRRRRRPRGRAPHPGAPVTAAGVAAIVASLSGPEGWLPAALRRLEQDPLARCLAAGERPALARAARAAGGAMAGDARRQGWGSAEAALRALGVDLVETDTPARAGPFV